MSSLAERLRGRRQLRLVFSKMPAPAEIEAAGYAGFDGVIIDTEHGPAAAAELEHHLRAADAVGLAALVRVPSAEPGAILAALDAGATGVIVPHITDPEGARAVVAAAHYPPSGQRGLALTTRAGRYGTAAIDEHLRRAARETLVIVQLEDAEAVPRAAEILAVDGVDAVLIGSTDLSISLGHPGDPDHPEVLAAIDAICEAAAAATVPVAAVVGTPAQAAAWFERGGQVAIFVATQLVRDALAAAAAPGSGTAVAGSESFAAGDGRAARTPPLVLLAGMLGTAALWADAVTVLGDVTTVYTPRIDLDDQIEEMADSVLAAAPAKFALAGHSLGAIVALAVARRAPERVLCLALLNASARPANDDQLAAWAGIEARVATVGFAAFAQEFARANLPDHRRAEPELVERVADMAMTVGPRGLARQLEAQRARPDSRPGLAQITCPAIVVCGAADDVCPAVLQEELAAGIPGAQLVQLPACGHMSPMEQGDEIGGLLAKLLNNPSHGRMRNDPRNIQPYGPG